MSKKQYPRLGSFNRHYLRNRLEAAFIAGAVWQKEHPDE